MNKVLSTTILAIAGAAFISQSAQAATYTAGDLLVGFRATGGTGATETYVFNLGSSIGFRDGTPATPTTIALGADLATIFGGNWFTRSDLFWGAVAQRTNLTTGVVNGDPGRTQYSTLPESVFGVQQTAPVYGSGARTGVASPISGFVTSFIGATATQLGGVNLPTSASVTWEEVVGAFSSQAAATIEAGSATGIGNTQLDIFRVLNTATGANPTGTVGTGSYEGSLTIDGSGVISWSPVPVPEPASFALFATGAAFLGFRRRKVA